MHVSLHSTLEAIVRFPHDPLSTDEAGHLIGRSGSAISKACQLKKITATMSNFRGERETYGARGYQGYRITKANLIEWLWRNESGDKALLREAMRDLCPRLLKALETRESPAASAKPKNVIAFEHPDLFPQFFDQPKSA
jgi:hypothetical protein